MSIGNLTRWLFGITPQPATLIDNYSRLRVSAPQTLFDSKQLVDKSPLFWDEQIINASGNAFSEHATVEAGVKLHVESGDVIIRQTRMRFNYQPGKSQLVQLTGKLGTPQEGTVVRCGQFDNNDGLFFQGDAVSPAVGIRKDGVDTLIRQWDWNIATLNNSRRMDPILDLSKLQLFLIDYGWLGTNSVRFGFIINGIVYYVHSEQHANQSDTVYMRTPNLPLRWEARSSLGVTDALHMCTSIQSEGGLRELGFNKTVSTAGTHLTTSGIDDIHAVLGIRLKPTHLGASVAPIRVSMLSENIANYRWLLALNPTIIGALIYASEESHSALETAFGTAGNIVDGAELIVDEGYVSNNIADAAITLSTRNALRIGSRIDGTRDELVLCVQPFDPNGRFHGSMTIREMF